MCFVTLMIQHTTVHLYHTHTHGSEPVRTSQDWTGLQKCLKTERKIINDCSTRVISQHTMETTVMMGL